MSEDTCLSQQGRVEGTGAAAVQWVEGREPASNLSGVEVEKPALDIVLSQRQGTF